MLIEVRKCGLEREGLRIRAAQSRVLAELAPEGPSNDAKSGLYPVP